ncbi:MAG: 30S ribosomal protein S21 [Patescibacteria group bacterium]|nr:30S ribosomal protein S21 [Patescibacteria group bacterium]
MSINAEVQKSGNENTLSTIRKFSRRVQGTGLIKTVRGKRYYSRAKSKSVQKKSALKRLQRRDDYRRMIKEGKIAEPTPRGMNRPQHMAQAEAPRRESSSGSGLGESTPIAR